MSSAKLFIQLLVASGVLLGGCTGPGWFNRPPATLLDHTARDDVPRSESAPPTGTTSSAQYVDAKTTSHDSANQPTAHRALAATAMVAAQQNDRLTSAGGAELSGDDELADLLQRTDPALQTMLAQQLSQLLSEQRLNFNETTQHSKVAASGTRHASSLVQHQSYAVAPPSNPEAATPAAFAAEHATEAASINSRGIDATAEKPASKADSPEDSVVPDSQIARASNATAASDKPDIVDWKSPLAQTIESLERELRDDKINDEQRERAEVYLRLLYVVADEREKAVEPLKDLDETESEFWKQQLRGLSIWLSDEGTPREDHRANLALQHLRQAADHLSAKSSLELRNVAFCTQVESYGRCTKFKRYDFKANQEVILYVEVDNFTPDLRDGRGQYETALQGSYEIFDASGRRVDEQTFPVEREVCSNRRRDFFIPYRMYMPKVPPGKYTLQLTVKDIIGDKFGQAPRIEFEIVR